MRFQTRIMLSLILVLGCAIWCRWMLQEPEPLFLTVHARSPDSAGGKRGEWRANGPMGKPSASPVTASEPAAPPAAPRPLVSAARLETIAGPEPAPGLTPAIVMENMRMAFRQYSSRFGGNPVGTNPEITRSLNGLNPGHVVFLKPEDGLRMNDRGELIDNWGTPFFFHQLSHDLMEIHSAGPDHKMWTADDLVIK